MCKIAIIIAAVGVEDTTTIINQRHAVEVSKSPTRKAELARQLSNPNAGLKAHLRSCKMCFVAVEAAQQTMTPPPLAAYSVAAVASA
jgi:hypothetical protein